MVNPQDILKQFWGFSEFRTLQKDIVDSVIEGNDTLALMPTGGGKSICFQVPTMTMDGLCIVVTPLIALMRDQVDQLQKRKIKSAAIYAGMSAKEIDLTLDNCIYGDFKFLYVSPERLKAPLFRERAEKMKICLLAIDEAHCISQWGYDFRPSYLEIADFRDELEISRTIALTATATPDIQKDIVKQLRLENPQVFQKSFARSNLSYAVFELENKFQKIFEILDRVEGSSIVYASTRKRTVEIASQIYKHGISAEYYHAGLSAAERNARQTRWIQGETRVIVSTNAFGMGIDKPNVRTVIHYDIPDCLEAYYQEAGRAGRDEQKAYAVLLFNKADIADQQKRIAQSQVSIELVHRVYQALANQYKLAIGSGENTSYPFIYKQFTENFNLPVIDTFHALKRLEDAGVLHMSEGVFQLSKVMITVSHKEIYQFQVAHAQLDPLIKSMLRLYGGELHSEFTDIKENEIAQLAKISVTDVVRGLELLEQYNLIVYRKSNKNPQLDYLTPRMNPASLPIDGAQLKQRRENALLLFEKMGSYALSKTSCRTRTFQTYFGEEVDHDCGVCDYCIRRKKTDPIENSKVLDLVPEEGIKITQLVLKTNLPEELSVEKIQQLIDDELLMLEGADLLKRK
ncbi:MAG: RecQ family ATP-dependent DNA helicase [Cyclobacteriaceae bacterium]